MYFLPTISLVLLLRSSSAVPAYAPNSLESCDKDQLRQCADNAEPVLRRPEYAVPDNPRDISRVCRTWTDLTTCVSNYTKRCLTPFKRIEFERETRESLSSMTSFCENGDQQKEYLNHAPCVKKISTQEKYCGKQYNFLIDLVSEGTIKQVCCARLKFMNCLMTRAPDGCENRKTTPLNATKLAAAILDSSLAFMNQRCESSRFEDSDCPGIEAGSRVNSKGPLSEQPNGNTLGSQTHFQLDQPRPTIGQKVVRVPLSSNPSTVTKEIKERPITGQLATGGSNQKPETRPDGGAKGKSSNLKSEIVLTGMLVPLALNIPRFSLTVNKS